MHRTLGPARRAVGPLALILSLLLAPACSRRVNKNTLTDADRARFEPGGSASTEPSPTPAGGTSSSGVLTSEPDWARSAGRSGRYPEHSFLTGYGVAQTREGEGLEALRSRATDLARTALSEGVIIRLKSETELYQETGRPDELRVLTETESRLDLEGLKHEEYFDRKTGRYHVLAYARRDLMQALYAEHTARAYADVSRAYREGQRWQATRPAEALRAYRRAERAYGPYEEEALISRALGTRASLSDATPAFTITRDSITTRQAELSERPIATLDDLAFSLAFGVHSQLAGTGDTIGTVAVAPLTVEPTPFGSALGRHLQGLVERQLARLGPLRVVNYATLPNGRIRADYVLRGSYSTSETAPVHVSLRRVMADGRSRLVASADARVALSLLRASGHALEAENAAELKPDYQQTAANQCAPVGGMRLEAWTNRGTESAVVTEGDTVWVYLRANRPAYVRLLYRLADGRTVLLYENYEIRMGQAGQAIRLPQAFVATPPFGAEVMTVLAADRPFAPLVTRSEDGYRIVRSRLPEAAMQSRGLTPVPTDPPKDGTPTVPYEAFAERTIGVTTLPRR